MIEEYRQLVESFRKNVLKEGYGRLDADKTKKVLKQTNEAGNYDFEPDEEIPAYQEDFVRAFIKVYAKEFSNKRGVIIALDEFYKYVRDIVEGNLSFEGAIKELQDEASAGEDEYHTNWPDPEDHEQPPGEVKPYRENY